VGVGSTTNLAGNFSDSYEFYFNVAIIIATAWYSKSVILVNLFLIIVSLIKIKLLNAG